MEKQKRPILHIAKGKLQIKAESNQKEPYRDLRIARKTTKMMAVGRKAQNKHIESLCM